MKTSLLAASVVSLLASLSAHADGLVSLKATDGTRISISYTTRYEYDHATGHGVTTVERTQVIVDSASAKQAVIVNNCAKPSGEKWSRTFVCDLVPGKDDATSSCKVYSSFVASEGFEGRSSSATDCTQQVAVVMKDNSWLVDPMNGGHNFNFRIN